MYAFQVHYKTSSTAEFSHKDIVLVESPDDISTALAAKSTHDFDPQHSRCSIESRREVPLERVNVSELSVAELMSVMSHTIICERNRREDEENDQNYRM